MCLRMQQLGSISSHLFYKEGLKGNLERVMGGEFKGMRSRKGTRKGQSSGTTGKTQEKSLDFQQSALATGSRHPPYLQAWLVQPQGSAQCWFP